MSCTVVDKDGKNIGDVAAMCDRAFNTRITILNDHDIMTSKAAL